MGVEPVAGELAVRAANGDGDAFRQLLEQHYDLIYRTAYRFSMNPDDAEDVAQDVCLSLVNGIRTYNGDAAFTTWLYRIVVNQVRDHQRKTVSIQKVAKSYGEIESMRKAEEMQNAYELNWLYEAMSRLGEDLRETAVLVVGEGLSHRDAGEILGIKESTVSWRMHELKKALREFAKEEA